MTYIEGFDRSQTLLLPPAIDDFVGPDNPVRFINAFVDELDLEDAGFIRAHSKATGRPGYHPGDLLRLYIYGYLNRIRSSRRLEAETHRNVEVMWLLRQLYPDFKTIADFRRDNRHAFKKVFRAFVLLCRNLNLFGRELIAVDGTRIKAVNNKDQNFTKGSLHKLIQQSDERLEKYLADLVTGDVDERGGSNRAEHLNEKIYAIRQKRDRLQSHLSELEQSDKDQISLTDPDARAMARMTKVGVGYNIQIAVDVKYKLIAEQQVHSNVLDYGLLTETAIAAKEVLCADTLDVIADRGCFQAEDIEACESAGMTPYVPKPERGPAKRDGLFPKEAFTYDANKDGYICPANRFLKFRGAGKVREMERRLYTGYGVCTDCSLMSLCTKAKFRQLSRYENEQLLERMDKRFANHPEYGDKRRNTVEHPFGTIKQTMNQGAFLMRRLQNVRGEFSLTALAYNIRRAPNILGVKGLMAAV